VWVEHKRLLKLLDLLHFSPFLDLLLQLYHDLGPGRPYYSPVAMIKALMLQRFRKAFESMVEQAIALGAVKGIWSP
jgi:hypothetical protein